jgi:CheY-like chemotaxis protein
VQLTPAHPAPAQSAQPTQPAPPAQGPAPTPARPPHPRLAQPLPAETAPVAGGRPDASPAQGRGAEVDAAHNRAISVRTLGQGVPFDRQAAQVQLPPRPGTHTTGVPLPTAHVPGTATPTPAPHHPNGSGRRRKLGTRPDATVPAEQTTGPHATGTNGLPGLPGLPGASAPAAGAPRTPGAPGTHAPGTRTPGTPVTPGTPAAPGTPSLPGRTQRNGTPTPSTATDAGRSYAIGAPDADAAEGPEPLDGPGGAVEVADPPQPHPMDDELPPEPLDNPRRLLVWPAPDMPTQQALSDRGYRPVVVNSRDEVDAQIAAFPAALFVDPLTGPITRTALQSLREAAVAAEVPVLVTAGLGQATRDTAYGADPAVLLKALAPRDSEQHPPRVLLVEEHPEIAAALTMSLERRGMQVARAADDDEAVALAARFRPNLVVLDLMRVRLQQVGIVDWLRANGQLNRTPLVVYTATVDPAALPSLASGETVLFLAERSTTPEVQGRIVDLLARIGTN